MKILLTGATGQVGSELVALLGPQHLLLTPGRDQLDLARPESLRQVVRQGRPALIINAGAYTAVDQAQTEAELAMRINAESPAVLAQEAEKLNIPLIHFSTDYVFDGSGERAWRESDTPHPLNVYGQSKLAGEQAVLASGAAAMVLRTQWVYGLRGRNFLLTMLRLATERKELKVVNDQTGAPTWSRSLARAVAAILEQGKGQGADWWHQQAGLYHVAAQGETSWYGFARRIIELSGLPARPVVTGISSSAYPTPARRPANGRLDCSKFIRSFGPLPEWDAALNECMAEWRNQDRRPG